MQSLESLLVRARLLDKEFLRKQNHYHRILSRAEAAVVASKPLSTLDRGNGIMDHLRSLCDGFDTNTKYRSPNQRIIQSRLSGGVARLVYGPDLLRYEKVIKKYNNFTTIRQESATTMPRRSGKSQSVGEWIASAMLAIPGFDGACFSNSGRAAGKEKGMLGIVQKCLMDHFGFTKEMFTIDNKECIQFLVNGNRRTFHSYPGACETLRGVGGNVIIVEESSYVTNVAFRELIIPLMTLASVCFICLSTLGEKTAGWFNKLIESDLVDAFVVDYVCKPCRAKGIIKTCIHRVDSLPHWGSEDRVALMQKMYGEENKEVYLREVMGIVEDNSEGRVFQKSKIMNALTNPHVEFSRAVNRIFVSIDPCGGSEEIDKTRSDWTVVAISEPYTTILGMEALPIVNSLGYRDKLEAFCTKLREDEFTKDAVLVFSVEKSMGFAPSDIYEFVRSKFVNIECISDTKRKEGVITDHKAKVQMMEIFREILDNDEVRFWKKFVTSHPNPAKLREKWAHQTIDYRRIFVKGETVKSHNSFVLTAKGESKDKQDDLTMATQIACRTRWQYERDPNMRPKRW